MGWREAAPRHREAQASPAGAAEHVVEAAQRQLAIRHLQADE